jgi:hypothetical protein
MTDSPDKAAAPAHWSHVRPRTFASVDVSSYIEERFNPMIEWYDGKAAWAKTRYLRVQAATVVGGALVPVLVNIDLAAFAYGPQILRGATTAISILVVILVALEGVLHYREQWVNYRSTEQFMRKEYYSFVAADGLYESVGDDSAAALRKFIERVEQAMSAENASTLQILTSTSDASPKESRQRQAVKKPVSDPP